MRKPIHRSKSRILVGRVYYTLKKWVYWYFSKVNFATDFESHLSIEIFTHKTILRRKLKKVDMWMQENKIANLKIAVEKLDRLVIEPGQTFSYWRQIGKPTKSKGYLEAMILHNGKVITGVGGGICQLSNLLYWITLHTPLIVIERWRHGYDVFPDVKRSQPFGSGATCAYPNIDLQFKNNTKQKFQLSLKVTDKYLIGKWLSNQPIKFKYEIFEKDHEIKHEWFGGYSRNNKIFRKVIDKNTNREISEEFITKNHALMMYNPLLE
ncbi:VanW family protein [Candidatus Parcubacteria bacterium]|nr:VanW family protein [Candidatus Parcubacteria bacterium]